MNRREAITYFRRHVCPKAAGALEGTHFALTCMLCGMHSFETGCTHPLHPDNGGKEEDYVVEAL